MRAKLIILAIVVMALAIPSGASAHTLSLKQARADINQLVQKRADYGYMPGTMLLYCGRRSEHYVRCDLLFTDEDGDAWCGYGRSRYLTRTSYTRNVYFDVNMRNCELF